MKKLLGLAILAAALAGCGANKVSFSSRVGAKSPAALTAAASNQLALNNGNITLNDVTLVVRRIRLEPTVTQAGTSSPGEDELAIGPFALYFGPNDLGGALVHEFTAPVTGGPFKEIEFEIHKVEPGDPAANPADATLLTEMMDHSVRIHGICVKCSCTTTNTTGDTTFTFWSALDEEQEREGTFPVGDGGNITLNINPINWFVDSTGAALDPCDPTNQSKIESNIKASIDAFEDDNKDGKPDK